MTLYLAVTADEYELPLAVAETLEGLATLAVVGSSAGAVRSSISKKQDGTNRGYKYIKVEVDWTPEDGRRATYPVKPSRATL